MTEQEFSGASSRRSMTVLLFVALLIFLFWAAWFEIDQTVRAQGQLMPKARTQIIQAADGGVLTRILVQEGESVVAGQKLAILERDRPNAVFEESRAKEAALAAALARARAEANDRPLEFGRKLAEFPEFRAAQQALYEQRKRSLQDELGILNDGVVLAQEELRMNESLFKSGDISQLEVMRARRQLAEAQGKVNAVRNKYLQEARVEATRLAEELSSSRYKLEERQSILDHTELTAPVAGVVKYLKVTTIGGVLRAGDELMQISPTDGEMVVEVKVSPVDIGQLKYELPVVIKLDAFDYSIYGTLQGTLAYISSDTLTEQGPNGQPFTYYRAQVRLDPARTSPKLADAVLKPGMTVTVDIRTDRRSVLHYLAKPVYKSFDGAMNER